MRTVLSALDARPMVYGLYLNRRHLGKPHLVERLQDVGLDLELRELHNSRTGNDFNTKNSVESRDRPTSRVGP